MSAPRYALACPNCVRQSIKYRDGRWRCWTCKHEFPAEDVLRIGTLPRHFWHTEREQQERDARGLFKPLQTA